MRHFQSSIIFFIFCVAFSNIHAEQQPTEQDNYTFDPEQIRSSALNIFGSIHYVLSNTGKLTSEVLYRTRDEVDRFVYDVRKFGLEENNPQSPVTNLENCLMLGLCGQSHQSPSNYELRHPVHTHFQR